MTLLIFFCNLTNGSFFLHWFRDWFTGSFSNSWWLSLTIPSPLRQSAASPDSVECNVWQIALWGPGNHISIGHQLDLSGTSSEKRLWFYFHNLEEHVRLKHNVTAFLHNRVQKYKWKIDIPLKTPSKRPKSILHLNMHLFKINKKVN